MESIEELIAKANEIPDAHERVYFIMNYFLENVRYNYAYLFAKGYAQDTISGVSNNYGITINKTRAEGDEKYSLTRSIKQRNIKDI